MLRTALPEIHVLSVRIVLRLVRHASVENLEVFVPDRRFCIEMENFKLAAARGELSSYKKIFVIGIELINIEMHT